MMIKKPELILIFICLFCVTFPAFLNAQDCLIVENGKPRAVIVYPGVPSARLSEAINELQSYIYIMSKAQIELKQAPQIGLNTLWLLTESMASQVPNASSLKGLNVEGFIIRVEGDQAWLYGRSELALQHAIYWLLEKWGLRWLFPGEAGEVVPSVHTLFVKKEMETAQQPRFLMRSIWYNWYSWLPEKVKEDYELWMKHNRLDYSLRGTIGHAYHYIVSKRDDKLFAEHSEYFILKNGKRVRSGQMCTSNPGVRQRAVEYAFNYFKNNPEATMVSMSPNDGGGTCESDECRAIGSFSDQALDLANYVADALKNNYETRNKMVAMYAYYITAQPPKISARDNVIIYVATRFTRLRNWHSLVKRWGEKVKNIGIRDYGSILPWNWTKPTWGLGQVKNNIQFWNENKVLGVSLESGNDWGGWGPYHYIMARLLWNPDEDIDTIFEDYVQSGFGTAANDMRRYFTRWRWGYSYRLLSLATRDVDKALKKVESEELRKRIGLYALYLHHLYLIYDYSYVRWGRKKEALQKLVAFDWRLVPTNMAHTLPYVEVYLKKKAMSRFRVSENDFNSWKRSEPFSREEILQYLKEDLKRKPRK